MHKAAPGAQQLAEQLRPLNISLIYSSPCQSAWQTASAIGEALDVKVKKVDSWQNVDHGLWQGMLVDDIRRKHPKVFRQWQEQPENICPPEGETLGDALQRARAALEKLIRKQKSGAVALVVPEPLAGIVRSLLVQGQIGECCKRKTSCGSWEVVDLGAPPALFSRCCRKDGKKRRAGSHDADRIELASSQSVGDGYNQMGNLGI